ncbi:MYXO-CTERM sorting domain-containing protein [Corallococcus sp. BB11-1]|uniref:MYXO-CTERM sorting domain-containing protein n=1 Tax=Corallococcus sp. BB11-1 TaxID=2996783 RepID=UPI00226F6D20|nr:MYXO-CTERM sorting domain-containing protein [Corallococcus sp. BB11-1]MCY1034410.1 MYXO-CTERM sorting domain-containing protein [Corallococcus sp. BB11-1]
MKRGLQRSVFLLGLLALAATASAQDPVEYKYLDHWVLNNSQDPFPYYLDSTNAQPGGNSLSLVEDAVKKAFQVWQDADCAWPAFTYKGRSTTVPIPNVADRLDGFSVSAIFINDSTSASYKDVLNEGDSVSETVVLSHAGYVYQCDIYLNDVDYNFTTLNPTPANFVDLQTAMMREVGHCLGLASTYSDENAVMYFNLGPGFQQRTLTAYDRGAFCQRYPQTGAVGSPCDSNSCSAGLTCVSTPSTTSGASLRICAKACPDGVPGFCPDPYVCRASTVVAGSSFACLPALGGGTKVGNPCTSPSQCGAAESRCLTPSDITTGFPSWKEGYCTESCVSGADCPRGSTCADVGGAVGKRCLKDCRPGTGDCRSGYTCTTVAEGRDVCVADCATNSDCGGNFACRSCDHACIKQQTGSRNVGDPCTQDTECGTNQQCLKVNGNPQGVCAEPCSVATCTCSPGNTCRPAGTGGDRFCFHDCSDGTCASPLQCVPFAEGTACLAPCRNSQDCPNGLYCGNGGKCYDPFAQTDGGTCALCGDAGVPPPPPPTDGGTGGPADGPDGCGCQGAPTSAAAFLAGLGVLLLATRKRRNG